MKSRFSLILLLLLLLASFSTGCRKEESPQSADAEIVPEAHPDSAAGFYLSISEEYARSMLLTALPDHTPFVVDTLDFSNTSTMTISGKVNLRALGEANDLPLYQLYPESIAFSTTGSFVYNKESGVSITPLSLEVFSFEIPLDTLPASLYQPYQEKINDYIASLPMTITDLYMTDTAIVITG